MNLCVYTLLLRVLAPFLWAMLAWRGQRAKASSPGVLHPQRFGYGLPVSGDAPVWVHAVSLGETRAAQSLVHALLDAGHPVVLTHMTVTGRDEGRRLFEAAIARGQLRQCWLPYDFPGATRRFLRAVAPRCGLLIERETWPNLLASAQALGVPMALVSARFSARSLKRQQRFGTLMRQTLGRLDRVLAQTPGDARRLREAGAPEPRVTGNLKFDVSLDPAQREAGQRWHEALGRPIVAIASTREGEDAMFIEGLSALPRQALDPLFILIPRHPQRFDDAAAQLTRAGLRFRRRSDGGEALAYASVEVVLGDTLGEMAFYYSAADIAIVAGSFAPLGGQNLIEASAAGTPVIVGPHTFNFEEAAKQAVQAGAAWRADDATHALRLACDALGQADVLATMRRNAAAWMESHRRATDKTLAALADLLARPAA